MRWDEYFRKRSTRLAETFAKKPFPRQPKPKHRFSAVGGRAFLQRSLALNFIPFPQDFKLLGRCAKVKLKFAFFQEQRERFAVNAVLFAQYTLRLVPKVLIPLIWFCFSAKRVLVVDAQEAKLIDIRYIIACITIFINDYVMICLLKNNRRQD